MNGQFFITASSSSGSSLATYVIVIFILIFIIFRRVSRGINGRPYTERRVLTGPIIYGILLLLFLYELNKYPIYIYIGLSMIVPGLIIGDRVGILSKVYWQNNILMYKRSVFILAITLSLYAVRLFIEFELPTNNIQIIATFDALIAISFGIMIGELLHLKSQARILRNSPEIADKMENA